jgi:AraC-like DNA-binding protein
MNAMARVDQTDAPLVHFARPKSMPGLELVHYPCLTRSWRGIPETYTWFTMIESLEGDVEVISRGIRAQCQTGSLTIGEPGEPYVLRARSQMQGEFRVLRIENELLRSCSQQLDSATIRLLLPREPLLDARVTRVFTELYWTLGDPVTSRLRIEELMFGLLHRVVDAGRGGTLASIQNDRGVRRARDLLHAQFNGEVSLDELASAAGVNKFSLLRAFSRELGMTPHAYQMQLRVARARRLITAGTPLAEVAQEIGYSEQSALNRAFKQLIGVTPGDYAQAH